jgi:Kelch motif
MTSQAGHLATVGTALVLTACQPASTGAGTDLLALLPEAVSNNAVAAVEIDGRTAAYSFGGLHAGKTWADVTADAYACDLAAGACREIDGLPDSIGRLAAIAATANDQIYIFGGYTVAEDGSEQSTPEVWRFDPQGETYARMRDMPLPVDDAVALVYEDRYIYLVSGWHDHDNVDAVQVYDTTENQWLDATDWPGSPVFGHAGGILGNRILVCGGVEVVPPASEEARRTFELYEACWAGDIDPDDIAQIDWQSAVLPGAARYRAGMTGSAGPGRFVVIGGTDNPYNYNGIGYNGEPSAPLAMMMLIGEGEIDRITRPNSPALMDHRGLIEWNGGFVTLGGMTDGQAVSREVRFVRLD